jgi:predicted chitinase
MAINRKFFFDNVRLSLFDGALKAPQVEGLTAILDKWEAESPRADDRWLAYMLGTAHHETGRTMQPVRETFATSDAQAISRLNAAFRAGRLSWVRSAYWNPDAQGKSWLGRGFVQITHKANYQKLGSMIGVDLTADQTRAMALDTALKIMFVGMKQGAFTGKKLGDFFSPGKEDWRNARRIINGIERADLVASYAKRYYASISYTV